MLDLVAELFCGWASEDLGTCGADVEGVRAPDSVSRWGSRRRMQDHISDIRSPLYTLVLSSFVQLIYPTGLLDFLLGGEGGALWAVGSGLGAAEA